MPPLAKEAFLNKFSVPCQDSDEARVKVKSLAGRQAATQRREALHRKNHTDAPTFDLSVWMPMGTGEEEVADFEKDMAQRLTTLTAAPLKCQISRVGSAYTQESTGRQSRLFRLVYFEQSAGGGKRAMETQQAKRIHGQLCERIPIKFPDWECR